MACKYRIRSCAKSDLESIWLYTLKQWGVEQADTYIKALIQQFDWIADTPYLLKREMI
jgi:toxin ParE1/3/4